MPLHSRNFFLNNLPQKWWWQLTVFSSWTWFFFREILFHKTSFSAAKQLWTHITTPLSAFWQRIYALSWAYVHHPYQVLVLWFVLILGNEKKIISPKQSCYSSPVPPQTQASTQTSHTWQAKRVLVQITCGLHLSTEYSDPELEAKESLCSLLPVLHDWIQTFKTGLLLSSCILDTTLRPRNSTCLFSQRQKYFKCYCRRMLKKINYGGNHV